MDSLSVWFRQALQSVVLHFGPTVDQTVNCAFCSRNISTGKNCSGCFGGFELGATDCCDRQFPRCHVTSLRCRRLTPCSKHILNNVFQVAISQTYCERSVFHLFHGI